MMHETTNLPVIGEHFLGQVVRQYGRNRILISERKQQRKLAAEIGTHTAQWFEGIASSGHESHPDFVGASCKGQTGQKVIINLRSIRIPSQNIPILWNHEESVEGQIGRATGIFNDGSSLYVQGILFRDKSKTCEVLGALTAGRQLKFYPSIGGDDFDSIPIQKGQPVVVNDNVHFGPFLLIERLQLNEISFVEDPSDARTWVRILSRRETPKLIAKRRDEHRLMLRYKRVM